MDQKYIVMCQKAPELTYRWEPKVGDMVSVVWADKNTGGLDTPRPLESHPVYGLEYNEYGIWCVNNGKIDGKTWQTALWDRGPNAWVVWYPTIAQLDEMAKSYGIDYLDEHIYGYSSTMGCEMLEILMDKEFHKSWHSRRKQWE